MWSFQGIIFIWTQTYKIFKFALVYLYNIEHIFLATTSFNSILNNNITTVIFPPNAATYRWYEKSQKCLWSSLTPFVLLVRGIERSVAWIALILTNTHIHRQFSWDLSTFHKYLLFREFLNGSPCAWFDKHIFTFFIYPRISIYIKVAIRISPLK